MLEDPPLRTPEGDQGYSLALLSISAKHTFKYLSSNADGYEPAMLLLPILLFHHKYKSVNINIVRYKFHHHLYLPHTVNLQVYLIVP